MPNLVIDVAIAVHQWQFLVHPFSCGTFWRILLQLILLLNYKDVLLFCFITMLFCPIVILPHLYFPNHIVGKNFNFLPDSDCTATDNSRLWGKIRFWILEKYLNIFWKRSLFFQSLVIVVVQHVWLVIQSLELTVAQLGTVGVLFVCYF